MSMNETFREKGRLAAIQSMITSNKNILLSFNLIENALRLMVVFFYPREHVHLFIWSQLGGQRELLVQNYTGNT